MSFRRYLLTLIPLSLLAVACKHSLDDDGSDLNLVSQRGRLWADASKIPVCFTNRDEFPGVAENIQVLLSKEFNRTQRIRFQGFGVCGAKNFQKPEIRIQIRSKPWSGGVVGCSHIGPEIEKSPHGCNLGGEANLYVSAIDWRTSIVHEVGHALGFRHEHHRPDRSENCSRFDGAEFDQIGRREMILETVFDTNSVMSYCGPRKALLSDLDIQGMNKVYAGPAVAPMPVPLLSVPKNVALYTIEFGTNGVCLAATKPTEFINPSSPGLGKKPVWGKPFETYPCTVGRSILNFKIFGAGDVKTLQSALNGATLVRSGNRLIQSHSGDNKWQFVPKVNGYFHIINPVDGQCLTLVDKKPGVGDCASPGANILVTEEEMLPSVRQ